MKKLSFKKLFFILPALLVLISGAFVFSNANAYAAPLTTLPNHFSVYSANYNSEAEEEEDRYTKVNAPNFKNGDAFFLKSNQAIILTFENLLPNTDISNLKYTITINGTPLHTEPTRTSGFEILNPDTVNFKMIINPAFTSGQFEYGTYSIVFDYWYRENVNSTNMVFECNFSILNYADYFNNISYSSTGDANNNYFYNYTTSNLFYISYKYNFYNVAITKVYQQLTYTTTITYNKNGLIVKNYNELSAETTQNYVLVNNNQQEKTLDITFKDIGIYYITYSTINPYSNHQVFENYCSQETPKKNATVYIFGYQSFYTGSEGLQEFKHLNQTTSYRVEQGADITAKATNGLQEYINTLDENSLIAKTNQAPVYFTTNATLALDATTKLPLSKYYYFASREVFNTSKNNLSGLGTDKTQSAYKVDNYYATPLSVAGIYLVDLKYTYSDYNSSITLTQYFMFEITNTSPSIQINELISTASGTTLGEEIMSDCCTKQNVKIQKSLDGVFDSPSVLTVYKDTAFNGHFDNGTIVNNQDGMVFTETASYKVVLAYGTKDANGNYRKKYTTNFIIDKEQIQNLQITSVKQLSTSLFIKDQPVEGLFANTSVALSWNEKTSGIRTYAEYKFFPTSYSTNFVNTLTSEKLKPMYEMTKNGIPSSDTFSYSNGQAPISIYDNTLSYNTLNQNQLLTQSGLYIIRVYDDTTKSAEDGQFKVLFIDKTTTNLIEKSATDDNWSLVKNNITTSFDHSLYVGNYKLIQFENLQTSGIDTWLSQKFLQDENFAQYFSNFHEKTYLKIATNNKVYYTINTVNQPALLLNSKTNNGFLSVNPDVNAKDSSISIKANIGETYNDNQYSFYIILESNNQFRDTFEYYSQNFAATHTITFSTDNSKMTLSFMNTSGVQSQLAQVSVINSTTESNTKYNYYQPTSAKTLSNSGEKLKFSYCISPSATLTVESITLEYYAFEKGASGTYIFNQEPTATLTIYDYASLLNLGTATAEAYTYAWDLYIENYNVSDTITQTRTRAGKYVIIRTYTEDSQYNSISDPKIRKLSFIVDRNGIISNPEATNNKLAYYTGGAIKLQVLNTYDSINQDEGKTLFFEDIYFGQKLNSEASQTLTPVLITNLLPVTVYVPQYKYGTNTISNKINLFNPEGSIVQYGDLADNKFLSFYQLSATVQYYTSNQITSFAKEVKLDTPLKNGVNFLTSSGSSQILSFTDAGYYKVTIYSSHSLSYGVDSFSFVFQINNAKPQYTLSDENNNSLNGDVNNHNFANAGQPEVYYTNKKIVRISWTDSESKFLSKINKDAITYKTSNGLTGKIEGYYTSGKNSHYVDLDLSSIKSYVDGAEIQITLQYEGDPDSYGIKSYFSKTTILKVDLSAPRTNIDKLVSQTGLSPETLREYVKGYNNSYYTSKTSGLFQYFSFNVDRQNLTTLLKSIGETNHDFIRAYYKIFTKSGTNANTKYEVGNTQESEIHLDNYNSSAQNILSATNNTFGSIANNTSYVNKYIEIIEEDYAGNRTVYTIYLTDITNSQYSKETAISYTSTTSTQILFEDLKSQNDIYSKYVVNLEEINIIDENQISNRYYQVVKVNNVFYVKTPYSNNRYYKADTTNIDTATSYTLAELSQLTSSANMQEIAIVNMPLFGQIKFNCYILNKVLEFQSLSSYDQDENKEGIVIQLPKSNATEANTLYATSLKISGKSAGTYFENIIFASSNFNDQYLNSVQNAYQTAKYKVYYISQGSNTYFVLEFDNDLLYPNDYFVYIVEDNFGEIYTPLIHIYGQVEIKEPISSNGGIVTSYDQSGAIVYYSSENIKYRFNTTIYSGNIEISLYKNGGTAETYLITKLDGKYVCENANYEQYFTFNNPVNGVMTIEFKQCQIEFINQNNENFVGGSYRYEVTLNLNSDFVIDQTQTTETKTLVVYNKIPKITMLGINGEVITSILNGGIYTNNVSMYSSNIVMDCKYEIAIVDPDGERVVLTTEYLAQKEGQYKLFINYLGNLEGLSKVFSFTISDTSSFKYFVQKLNDDGTYSIVNPTNSSYSYKDGNNQKMVQIHYIVNGPYKIDINPDLKLVIPENEKITVDEYTTIYNIHTDYNAENVTEFYSTQIAVTSIPKTNSLFNQNDFVQYDSLGNLEDLTTQTSIIAAIYTEKEYQVGKRIAWSKYYLIPENKISATIYYGEIGGDIYTPKNIESDSDKYAVTIKTSGIYYFKFSDIAGNTHYFGLYNDNEYFSIKYLSSVIYEINDQTPINYAMYNNKVKISIDESTLTYYDTNARPIINVFLNGKPYQAKNVVTANGNKLDYVWEFTENGLYKVNFSAKIKEQNIHQEDIYFTILSANETRASFNYSSYNNYYIQDILLNGISVNDKLANSNTGNMYDMNHLKDIALHKYDLKTGQGKYTFVINTNNEFGQKFEFTIWINDATVPIIISENSGTVTTNNIKIIFNTKNMLEDAGDCILKITGYEDFVLTKEKLDNKQLNPNYEIVLTTSRNYSIEVTTLSGQLLFSSYVVKNDPLNTISILIIVIVVALLVVGLIIFIKMRKKLKVK